MTGRPLVAANWKMHGRKDGVRALAAALVQGAGGLPGVDLLVCPAFVHLDSLHAAFAGTGIALGAQNLHQEDEGAYTGEVSGGMLRDAGCTHVLVGHSERRAYYAESDALVALKFGAALRAGLLPVLCVGETREEREAGQTGAVVGRQLQAVIDAHGVEAVCGATVAYEPVWAIGTGVTATPEQAQEVHALIRDLLREQGGNATLTRLLYGGSVKAANAAELFAQADIDGALVGGASLVADEFLAICRSAAVTA